MVTLNKLTEELSKYRELKQQHALIADQPGMSRSDARSAMLSQAIIVTESLDAWTKQQLIG